MVQVHGCRVGKHLIHVGVLECLVRQKLVFGIPPAVLTDRDLATEPVIVVAKADKTGIFGVRVKSGDVEKRATIIVERVVAGTIRVACCLAPWQ